MSTYIMLIEAPRLLVSVTVRLGNSYHHAN